MDKPSKIKIGHIDYAIKWVGSDWALENNRRGEISYIKEEIRVCDTLSPQSMADTFMHEVIHAIVNHFSRTSTEPIEREDVSEWLGAGLVMVWRDNPDVFAWWSELLVEKGQTK